LHQTASNVPSLSVDLDAETMEVYAKEGWPLELLKDLCREAVRNLTRVFNKQTFLQTFERLFEAWQTNSNCRFYKQIQTKRLVCLVCLKQWYRSIFSVVGISE
jgi:hypothetical protein